jgi:hypothetical protein
MGARHGLFFLTVFFFVLPVLAQDPAPAPKPTGTWQPFGDSQPAGQPPAPTWTPSTPPQLVLRAGTWITVRVGQPLSSDHNKPGDGFSATLVQPVVTSGLVIARRDQNAGGKVVEAVKAGRVKGTSRLGLELTGLTLVDGQQVPVRTQLIQYSAGSSKGIDAGVIATTTATGAAIGGAVAGGFGAGMGAIAGAGASIIGVLVTRGLPTVVPPEAVLTFRTLDPVTISTALSARAFRPVTPQDFNTAPMLQPRPIAVATQPYFYGGYGYGYPYWYPYGFGAGFGYYYGPRYSGYARGGYWHH